MTTKWLKQTLTEILNELKSLNAAPRPRRDLSKRERQIVSLLIPAIEGTRGDGNFTTKELLADPAFEGILRGLTNDTLGRLLSKATGLRFDGRTIERLTAVHNAGVWKVAQTNPN